jgi:hypothetical protein
MTFRHAHATRHETASRLKGRNSIARVRGKPSLAVVPEEQIGESRSYGLVPDVFAYQRDVWERWILPCASAATTCWPMNARESRRSWILITSSFSMLVASKALQITLSSASPAWATIAWRIVSIHRSRRS